MDNLTESELKGFAQILEKFIKKKREKKRELKIKIAVNEIAGKA